MLSIRHGGQSIPEIVGRYLGTFTKHFMRVFAVVLLVLVGVVFVKGPVGILNGLTGLNTTLLAVLIFGYYLLATMVPIDKLIGKIYPIFGASLLIMALGLFGALLFQDYTIPELTLSSFTNLHSNPKSFPIFPVLFITIACGAISGFHATQSPLMARCISNEKDGKKIFFGAMITEGIVAMIWAAAAMAFFGGIEKLGEEMVKVNNNAAPIVNIICNTMLGRVGGILAIIGVVAAPITSGDTALRSARLTIADSFNIDQSTLLKRLYVTIPIFAIAIALTQIDFGVIWRYFGWSNQVLATIVLWTAVAYMKTRGKRAWYLLIPSAFMTAVVSSFILFSSTGFSLPYALSVAIGVILAVSLLLWFAFSKQEIKKI